MFRGQTLQPAPPQPDHYQRIGKKLACFPFSTPFLTAGIPDGSTLPPREDPPHQCITTSPLSVMTEATPATPAAAAAAVEAAVRPDRGGRLTPSVLLVEGDGFPGGGIHHPLSSQQIWTAIGFVDGSEKLGLWLRLPSWFSSIS